MLQSSYSAIDNNLATQDIFFESIIEREDGAGGDTDSTIGTTKSQMQNLLFEFKSLYEDKLNRLEKAEYKGEDVDKKKIQILQSYLKDIAEQNDVLINSVDELEMEANKRVQLLESKLQKTTDSVQNYMSKVQFFEQELRASNHERTLILSSFQDMEKRLCATEEEKYNIDVQVENLTYDIDSLISIMTIARTTGIWDLEDIKFKEISFDKVFGPSKDLQSRKISSENEESLCCQNKTNNEQYNKQSVQREIDQRDEWISVLQSQVDDLRGKLLVREEQLKDVENKLKLSQQDVDEKKVQVSALEDSTNQLCKQLSCAKDQESQTKLKMTYSENRISSLETCIDDLKVDREKLLSQLQTLQADLRQDQHPDLQAQLRHYDSRISSLNQEMASLKDDRNKILSQNNENESVIQKLHSDLDLIKRQLQESEDEKSCLSNTVRSLEGNLLKEQQQCSGSFQQVQDLTATIQKLQLSNKSNKETFYTEINTYKKAIESLKSEQEVVETQINKYRTNNEITHQQLKAAQTELASARCQIKELTEEAQERTCHLQKIETDRDAKLEEIDNLKRDLDLKEKMFEDQFNSEMFSKQEQITSLIKELSSFKNKLAQTEALLRDQNEKLKRSESLISELETNKMSQDNELCKLNMELASTSSEKDHVTDEAERLHNDLQHMEVDFDSVKEAYKEALEENGRLEARIQAYELKCENDQKLLTCETSRNDSVMQKLKIEQLEMKSTIQKLEDKKSYLENDLEKYNAKLIATQNDNELKTTIIAGLEADLREERYRMSAEQDHINRLESQLKDSELDSFNIKSEIKSLHQSILTKDELINKYTTEGDAVKKEHSSAVLQMSKKDETIEKLSIDLNKIKSKYKDKMSEIEKYGVIVHKLQEGLSKCQSELDVNNKKSLDELNEKENTIKQLHEDLLESQAQHTTCCNELIGIEDTLDVVKIENHNLSESRQSIERELTLANQRLEDLHLELSLSQQKHQICISELSVRDETILKLQAEVDMIREKYSCSMEECNNHGNDIKKYKDLIDELQKEKDALNEQISELDSQNKSCKLRIMEQQLIVESSELEINKHLSAIERLHVDQMNINMSHSKDIQDLQDNLNSTRKQLDITKCNLTDTNLQCSDLKGTISKLEFELEEKSKDNNHLNEEILRHTDSLTSQEDMYYDCQQIISDLESKLKTSNLKNAELAADLNALDHKHSHCLKHMELVETSLDILQENLTESNSQRERAMLNIDKLNSDLQSSDKLYQESCQELQRHKDVLCQMSQELKSSQQQCHSLQSRLSEVEGKYNDISALYEEKEKECSTNQTKLEEIEEEFDSYKNGHRHSDIEFSNVEGHVSRLEFELVEVQNELELKSEQIESCRDEIKKSKLEMDDIQGHHETSRKEVMQLESALQEAHMKVTSTVQHYRATLAKQEQSLKKVTQDLESIKEKNQRIENELSQKTKQLEHCEREKVDFHAQFASKVFELQSSNTELLKLKQELSLMENTLKQDEKEKSELHNNINKLKTSFDEVKGRYRDCTQKLVHYEERVGVLEQSLQTTHEQLSNRVTEITRMEETRTKVDIELKNLRDRSGNSEEEITRQRGVIEGLRQDLLSANEMSYMYEQERISSKQQVHKLEISLDEMREQEKKLKGQLGQQDQVLGQLTAEIKLERGTNETINNQLQDNIKEVIKLKSDLEHREKQNKDIDGMLREKDDTIVQLKFDNDAFKKKNEVLSNKLFSKEQQLSSAQINLQQLHSQISPFEQTLKQVKEELERSKSTNRNNKNELMECKKEAESLRSQLSVGHGKQTELNEQLVNQTHELSVIKCDLAKSQHHEQSLTEELILYEENIRVMRSDIRDLKEVNSASEEQRKDLETRFTLLQGELLAAEEHKQQITDEASKKENIIKDLNVKLKTLSDKDAANKNTIDKSKAELLSYKEKCKQSMEEIRSLREALRNSRENGNSLQEESELVIHNINQWVHEQKKTNEVLCKNIRNHEKLVSKLKSENLELVKQLDNLQIENNQLHSRLDKDLPNGNCRLLTSLLEHQNVRCDQMNLHRHDSEPTAEVSQAEDWPMMLQKNTNNMRHLSQQLSAVQSENNELRKALKNKKDKILEHSDLLDRRREKPELLSQPCLAFRNDGQQNSDVKDSGINATVHPFLFPSSQSAPSPLPTSNRRI